MNSIHQHDPRRTSTDTPTPRPRFIKTRVLCTHPDGDEIVSPAFDSDREARGWAVERADEGCSCFGFYGVDPNDPWATVPELAAVIAKAEGKS